MAKVALLIGVSEYGEGLSALPGTQKDIAALQRVLQNPQISGFDQVDALLNPDRTQMELAIETLFTENRSRDDLVLLYFSGHGVRDDNGALYFANRITAKNAQGRIRTSTAIPATALQRYMGSSRSKRQILILDCCFSGAFANDMKAKQADEAIDMKTQLGGEGRAVLTSSTATQVTYEKEGTSIYTRYLIQGLETGAADRDEDGQITVDELHEYAREKVQEAAPSMQPEIYAVREGYKILIARSPQGDPKRIFRKELDIRAKEKRGQFSPAEKRAFRFRGKELGVSETEAKQITDEILQPYQEFWKKLEEFNQAVEEMREYDPQLSVSSINDLRYLQRVLKLRDEDIAPVLNTHQINFNAPATPPKSVKMNQGQGAASHLDEEPQSLSFTDTIPLESETGVDYCRLRHLLKARRWKEADQETARCMLQAMRKEKWWDVDTKDLLHFPYKDLKTIDRLWVHYSNCKFGFSVQKNIYVDCGAKLDGKYPGDKIWYEFCDRVGWRNNSRFQKYDDLTFNLTRSRAGELPSAGRPRRRIGGVGFSFLVQRIVNLSTNQS
jgi:hypothetical protein